MDTIAEIEKSINDIKSFNYANEYEISPEENEQLCNLINKGISIGSPYAMKLKAMQEYYKWRASKTPDNVPDELIAMLERSARYGFKECMTLLAEKDELQISPVKRYAFLKLSKTPPGCGYYDLDDFKLDHEQEKEAIALYEEMQAGLKKFYENFEQELLIGAEGYNGEWDTV